MIQEFQLRALPEQAISEQALKQFIGREKGLDIRTIHSIRVLKRSIDARQRTIYVNLKVRLYINEIPHDEEFVRTEYRKVENSPGNSGGCRSRRTVCRTAADRVGIASHRGGKRKERARPQNGYRTHQP